jgi:hypothetical protein
MELLWPVLAVMVPLFIGGAVALVMYWRRNPAGGDARIFGQPASTAGQPGGGRRRLPRGPVAIAFYVAAGLVVALVLAVAVGFPILRSLLIVLGAPIDPT